MHDIFLSYSKDDKDFAKSLANKLEKEGFDVWWDDDITSETPWDSQIEEVIGVCKCIVVLWSRTSINKEWVRVEAAEGKRRNILVAVRIEDVQVPLAFRRRQYIDLIDWDVTKKDHPGFQDLQKNIRNLLSKGKKLSPGPQPDPQTIVEVRPKPLFTLKRIAVALIGIVLLLLVFGIAFKSTIGKEDQSPLEYTVIEPALLTMNRSVDTPDPLFQEDPIFFNTSDEAKLLFYNYRLRRKSRLDSFYIDGNYKVRDLKKALVRHYRNVPLVNVLKDLPDSIINRLVVTADWKIFANHVLIENEDASLNEAQIDSKDHIELKEQLVINSGPDEMNYAQEVYESKIRSLYDSLVSLAEASVSESAVPVEKIEEAAIYPGCENSQSNDERVSCMSDKIQKFVLQRIDSKRVDWQLEGERRQVNAAFEIDSTGSLSNINVKAPKFVLELEVEKALESMPKMIPAKQGGTAIEVSCELVFYYRTKEEI